MKKKVAIFRGTLENTNTTLVEIYDLSPSYSYSVGKDHRSVNHVAVSQITIGNHIQSIVIKLDTGSLALKEENFVEDTVRENMTPKECLESLGYVIK